MSEIKKKLVDDYQMLSSASKLYSHLIENNRTSQDPESSYMLNLLQHKKNLENKAQHSLDKSKTESCLNCSKVEICQSKCEEFSKHNKLE